MSKCYTGVGSRSTPGQVLVVMKLVAQKLRKDGWILRSGAAEGADNAFESGAKGKKEIYVPWKGFAKDKTHLVKGDYSKERDLLFDRRVMTYAHWERLKVGGKKLHCRNVNQVLGFDLDSPSKFLLFWAPMSGDEPVGGTRTAVLLARCYDIPVFRIGEGVCVDVVIEWVLGLN